MVEPHDPDQRGVAGVGAAALAALTFLSLWSYGPARPNLIGAFGAHTVAVLAKMFGFAAWCVPATLGLAAHRLLFALPLPSRTYVLARLALVLLGAALLHLGWPELLAFGEPAAGALGEFVGEMLRATFGLVGAVLVAAALLLIVLVWQRLVRITRDPVCHVTASTDRPLLAAPSPPPLPPRLSADKRDELLDQLASYGVTGSIDRVHRGPILTTYEFAPARGVKMSKIARLADDLAMGLGQPVRVAPIPGRARVGFEVPNETRRTVSLGELLADRRWQAQRGPLPVALGATTRGEPVYADLSEMPHMLAAGTTGSGKSVGLNAMITSLLSARTPEHLRLILIDPKHVEFASFADIPHLMLPVVTDMREAGAALGWVVGEMDRRYQRFAAVRAHDLLSHNERAEPLPHLVCVVDELADLMRVARPDVEAAIAALAPKARAAGIHLVLATQRPSVDVVTGTIKANFPARIAFKVSQPEDSRVILGRLGAEHLLGAGDLLMLPPSSSEPTRIHGAHVTQQEVREFCDVLRAEAAPIYATVPDRASKASVPETPHPAEPAGSSDPLYERAVEHVRRSGTTTSSVSALRDALGRIGHSRAEKLLTRLEREGVVTERRRPGRPARS